MKTTTIKTQSFDSLVDAVEFVNAMYGSCTVEVLIRKNPNTGKFDAQLVNVEQ